MTAVDDWAARVLPVLERWWPGDGWVVERRERLARDIGRTLADIEAERLENACSDE